jgi:hypothetical protein
MSIGKRWLHNFIAVCVVVLFFAVLLVTTGCAGQGVKLDVETSGTPCGTKVVKFSTDYQVENLEIGRTIEGGGENAQGGEGCGGGYTVSLGKGTTKDAEMGLILEMFKMVMSVAVPGYAAPQNSVNRNIAIDDSQDIFEAGIEEGRRQQTKEFNR